MKHLGRTKTSSSDFNSIERHWQHFKSHCLAGFITKRRAELSDKIFESIQKLLTKPETLRSVYKAHTQ